MIKKRQFSAKEAQSIGSQLKIDSETNVTGDDLVLTGKIAWAHLKEIRDYYTRLERMEAEAEEQLKKPAKN